MLESLSRNNSGNSCPSQAELREILQAYQGAVMLIVGHCNGVINYTDFQRRFPDQLEELDIYLRSISHSEETESEVSSRVRDILVSSLRNLATSNRLTGNRKIRHEIFERIRGANNPLDSLFLEGYRAIGKRWVDTLDAYTPKCTAILREHEPIEVFPGESQGMKELQEVGKREMLGIILAKRGIDLSDSSQISVKEETLATEQMRQIPYCIVVISCPETTIVISDEIGQMTFVYHGKISPEELQYMSKQEFVERGAKKVGYSPTFTERLEKVIFEGKPLKVPGRRTLKSPEEYRAQNTPEQYEIFRQQFLAQQTEIRRLTGIDIRNEAGVDVWYFGDAGMTLAAKQLQIGENKLQNFPSRPWNKHHGVALDNGGGIRNPEHLRELAKAFKIRVASPEEEEKRWRDQLMMCMDEIHQKAKIGGTRTKWKIWDATISDNVIAIPIGKNNLGTFPNSAWLLTHGNNKGKLSTIWDYIRLARKLKVPFEIDIQEEEAEYKKIWLAQFLEKKPEICKLADIEIRPDETSGEVWYTRDNVLDELGAAGDVEIGGQPLIRWPSMWWNIKNSIGIENGHRGQIKTVSSLIKLAKRLGVRFRVATPEEEVARWREQLLSAELDICATTKILPSGPIGERTWDFSNAVYAQLKKVRIMGKTARCFPNVVWNRENEIGENGSVTKIEHFKKLARTLGITIIG